MVPPSTRSRPAACTATARTPPPCARRTMAAEGVLHDLGLIAISQSDSQGMGRVGEVVRRAFQNAAAMRRARPEPGGDNERVLRHLAKCTINPAIAHGLAEVGALTRAAGRHRASGSRTC